MKRIFAIKAFALIISLLLMQFTPNVAKENLGGEPGAEPAKTASEPGAEPAKTAGEPGAEPAKTAGEPAAEPAKAAGEPAAEPAETAGEPAAEPAEEASPEAESATEQKPADANNAEAAALLADKHNKAGFDCTSCHQETPPAAEAPTAVCLTCHANYKDQASSYIDPHNAHTEFTNCSDCHHVHKKSENQCLQCHTFEVETP